MLDDLKYIYEKDTQDALGVTEKQWQQLTYEFDTEFTPRAEIRNVVVNGMGGSGWPANYIKSWPGAKVPMELVSDYNLPFYVDRHTLVIATSYSGNTEETLSGVAEAEALGAQIAVFAAGGKLKELAESKNFPLYVIPSGTQPRMSSFYFIAAYLDLLGAAGLIDPVTKQQRKELSDWLGDQVGQWRADVPTSKNPAKQLALELAGKTTIIYAGPLLAPVAQKMKICMNENAKNTAWWNQYPELSHNEFIGWSSHPIDKPFGVVEIRSNLEHDRTQKRFDVTERLLSGMRPAPHVIVPEGETLPQQIFWSSIFCDFVCTYVALLNGVNPTPVDLVEKFKKELD